MECGGVYEDGGVVVLGFQVSAPLATQKQTETVLGNLNHVKTKYSVLGQIRLGYAVERFLPYVSAGIGRSSWMGISRFMRDDPT